MHSEYLFLFLPSVRVQLPFCCLNAVNWIGKALTVTSLLNYIPKFPISYVQSLHFKCKSLFTSFHLFLSLQTYLTQKSLFGISQILCIHIKRALVWMKLSVLVKRWDLSKSQYIIYNGSLYLIMNRMLMASIKNHSKPEQIQQKFHWFLLHYLFYYFTSSKKQTGGKVHSFPPFTRRLK